MLELLPHSGRGDGQVHCQMGRQRLVSLGFRDEWQLWRAWETVRQSMRWRSSGPMCMRGRFHYGGWGEGSHIAKWDGVAWSALSSGMDYPVHALAVIGTELYAGGEFTQAGGVPPTISPNGTGIAGRHWARGLAAGTFLATISGSPHSRRPGGTPFRRVEFLPSRNECSPTSPAESRQCSKCVNLTANSNGGAGTTAHLTVHATAAHLRSMNGTSTAPISSVLQTRACC